MVPWYPKAILSVTACLFLALRFVPGFRRRVSEVDLRVLIGVHLVRFVGIYFLYLYAQGELPYRFAVWGGSGDIAVATLALIVMRLAARKAVVGAWNVLGLADIIGVVVTAARSEMAVPGSMHQLNQFPLILLPTVVVPVIIVTHAVMLVRMSGVRTS
jgi:hypothetical protein